MANFKLLSVLFLFLMISTPSWTLDVLSGGFISRLQKLEKGKPIEIDQDFFRLDIHDLRETLYSDSFSKLAPVKDLRIATNYLKKIEDGAICSFATLQRFTINFNKFIYPSTLTKHTFDNCENLEELAISLRWVKVENDTFENLTNLKRLLISDSVITNRNINRLSKELFKNLKSLTALELPHDNIETIDSEAFDNLSNLEMVDFSWNLLKRVPTGLFKNTPNLDRLILQENRIEDLNWTELKQLHSLNYLDLAGNTELSYDAEKVAAYLPNLLELTIGSYLFTCSEQREFKKQLKEKVGRDVTVIRKNKGNIKYCRS